MRKPFLAFTLCLAAGSAFAFPFWGAKESSPIGTSPAALNPGEFVWAPGIAPDGPIVVHPAALVPVSASSGEADIQLRLATGEKWRWEPEKSPDGPVSMMMSAADQRIIVLRNGVEIGRSRVFISDAGTLLGTHAFIVKAGAGTGESPILKGAAAHNWMEVPMPGYGGTSGNQLGAVVGNRMRLPQDFAKLLYPLLAPGTTLLVTDAPMLEENSGKPVTVMGAGNPNTTT